MTAKSNEIHMIGSQQAVEQPFPETMSLEELVESVTRERQIVLGSQAAAAIVAPIAPIAPPRAETSSRTGGAFGGALKRRIGETDTPTRLAATNQDDIYLLRPLNINRELFDIAGDQVYHRVLLTPAEMGAVTFSAQALTRRVGSKVLAHTVERPASDRHARKQEVITETLQSRAAAAENTLTELSIDGEVFSTLREKMKSPGYAHMKGEEMDALMAHAEGRFVHMIEAILLNHKLSTERVKSLTSALDYNLGNDQYKQTFKYWAHMTTIGLNWTNKKIELFENVSRDIKEEQLVRA
jgi:phospholipid N-methyltransferase